MVKVADESSGVDKSLEQEEECAKRDGGEPFKQGGEKDLSCGPVKKRYPTNPEWCIIFAAHIVFFWICALQGTSDGNVSKLINPRDYSGLYCGLEKDAQWNAGSATPNLESFENALWTLNLTATVDPIAREFICSTAMKSALTAASVATDVEYTAACGASLSSSALSGIAGGVTKFVSDPTQAAGWLTGGVNPFSALSKYFHEICTTKCSLTSADATLQVQYSPAPDAQYYSLWTKMVTYCTGTGSSNSVCMLDQFKFNALPTSLCPYADTQKCVLIPAIKFTELTNGYCTIQIDTSAATAATADYLNDLAESELLNGVSGGLSSAIGDIQNTVDVFVIMAVLSLVCGFVYLVLLRFLVKPVVWASILLVFLFFIVGGALAMRYSMMCESDDITSRAETQASAAGTTAPECGGAYKIKDETNRDILKVFAYILFVLAAIYLCMICCLFNRIRLAIAINEVAAMFVFETPHIVFVPIIQTVIGILWTFLWMFLAAFLLSQVPEDYISTSSYSTYDAAMTQCEDPYPQGFAWHDTASTDCINDQKCWKCAPPRYIVDYRFGFSFFSFLWHNAFFIAVGQCIIAGAVGLWFFRSRGDDASCDRNKASRKGVCIATKNALVWHPGSLAFGSFILAVVQFLKYLMYYISKQAKAQGNKCLEIVAKIAGYCLWCFEKCVKFLNKNAYIQIALMGTPFCVSAKNAFFLIMRNAVRFAVMGSLGGVIRFIGKGFVMITTGLLGFLILQSMHPDLDTPYALVMLYVAIGYFTGALFMNVFGLAVDSTLQCFIATEEMGIDRNFIPERLQGFVNDTENASKTRCCGSCCP
jgi:hypothetical protein